jgi:hypothetical protein
MQPTSDSHDSPVIDLPDEVAKAYRSVIRYLRAYLVHRGWFSRREAAGAICQVILGKDRISRALREGGVIGRSRQPLPWKGPDDAPVREVCLLFTPVAPDQKGRQDPETAGVYRLRFFFDTGSGICLWSANDAAREKFDYPVPLEALPLPETIRRRGEFLIAWYDTFMDWELSPQPSRWWPREQHGFNAATQELLALLEEHLGPAFELVDESGTLDNPEPTAPPDHGDIR